jgi:hypothetical protein
MTRLSPMLCLFSILLGLSPSAPSALPAMTVPQGTGQTPIQSLQTSPYTDVITAEAVTDPGLFVVHRVGERWYFEIPVGLLDREMLIVSRRTRAPSSAWFDFEQNAVLTVRWQRQDDRILLRYVSHADAASDSVPIARAVRNVSFEPVLAAFDIATVAMGGPSSTSVDLLTVVIDVTDLFTTDVPMFGLPASTREQRQVRGLDRNRTFITSVKSFQENIEVRVALTYGAAPSPSNAGTGATSIELNYSMILLPEEPMRPRLADDRVGYFALVQTDYGLSDQHVVQREYINRWRLEPSDTAAFLRGELVEPVKPIVIYIDPATPERWRPYLKEAVEAWNPAFTEAGFRNAIIARDPPSPEEDPDFDPEDIRYSMIHWRAVSGPYGRGSSISDPRSGEILVGSIGFGHSILDYMRTQNFIYTAAANPEARCVTCADSVIGEALKWVATHEVGHSLGLPHNWKASFAYPLDSLRSGAFTCANGMAPSIMDYAAFNYVAQPGDAGVCFLGRIGPYDRYAIMWGYRPLLDAASAEDERAILDQWIRERSGDPVYHFGWGSLIDPTQQGFALGDDPIRATEYGLLNLQRLASNLLAWSHQERESNDELERLYGEVVAQWSQYVNQVVRVIGGVVETLKSSDEEGAVFTFVDAATQRRALQFLADRALTPPTWLIADDVLSRIEYVGTVERMRDIQVTVVDNLLDPGRLQRLIEGQARFGPSAYGLEEMLGDLRDALWWELNEGHPIDVYRRNLQRGYVERMAYLMTEGDLSVAPEDRMWSTEVNVPQSDIRSFARGELDTVKGSIIGAGGRYSDTATRFHLDDLVAQIERILGGET